MATMLSRTGPRQRKRMKNPLINQPQPANAIYITTAAIAGSVLTLTLDQAVTLDGTPQFTTSVAGATPLSAAQTAPHIVAITFSAPLDGAESIHIPFRDPAIRNTGGGYVTATQVAV